MTRSVEIPEAAREKAAAELYGAMGGSVSQWLDIAPKIQDYYRELTDLMLSAALPYLAPAGDGGLREALGDLVEHWRYKGENLQPRQEGGGPDPYEAGLDDAATALKKLLAAAPAVPQPVDRRELLKLFEREGVTTTRVMGELAYRQELADAVLALLAGEQSQAAITNPDAIQRCPARGYADEPCVRPALHDGSHEWFGDGGEQEQVESQQ